MTAFDTATFETVVPGLIADLVAKDGLSATEATDAVSDYGRFLSLVVDDRATCPPMLADKAWHRHMEQPAYADQVKKMCGRVLNHDANAYGTVAFDKSWADTCARWEAAYGPQLDTNPANRDTGRFSATGCNEQP